MVLFRCSIFLGYTVDIACFIVFIDSCHFFSFFVVVSSDSYCMLLDISNLQFGFLSKFAYTYGDDKRYYCRLRGF